MVCPNFFIFYVDSPERSAAFYQRLFEKEPLEASPTFVLFEISTDVRLGLWSRHGVKPEAQLTGGGGEIAFCVATVADVEALFAKWTALGLSPLQPPTDMDFGFTFVCLDPDGHRLRVFTPESRS